MPIELSMNAVRPKQRSATTGTLVGTRFQAQLLEAIDGWRKQQVDLPTRPEAVRRLVELGMTSSSVTAKDIAARDLDNET